MLGGKVIAAGRALRKGSAASCDGPWGEANGGGQGEVAADPSMDGEKKSKKGVSRVKKTVWGSGREKKEKEKFTKDWGGLLSSEKEGVVPYSGRGGGDDGANAWWRETGEGVKSGGRESQFGGKRKRGGGAMTVPLLAARGPDRWAMLFEKKDPLDPSDKRCETAQGSNKKGKASAQGETPPRKLVKGGGDVGRRPVSWKKASLTRQAVRLAEELHTEELEKTEPGGGGVISAHGDQRLSRVRGGGKVVVVWLGFHERGKGCKNFWRAGKLKPKQGKNWGSKTAHD